MPTMSICWNQDMVKESMLANRNLLHGSNNHDSHLEMLAKVHC